MSGPKLAADLVIRLIETGQVQMPQRFDFRKLSVKQQWEYQRRNPVYQMIHDWAVVFLRQHSRPIGDLADQAGDDVKAALYAAQTLSQLGLSGYTPPPWTDYEHHAVHDDESSGARPVSRIDLIAELMRDINDEQADLVGSLLADAVAMHQSNPAMHQSNPDVDFTDLRAKIICHADEWLCEGTNPEIVYLNVKSTIGSIKADVQKIWDDARDGQSVRESRRSRIDEACLFAAWDQREGWVAGRYEPDRERKLSNIVLPAQTDEATPVPRSAYTAAFRSIIGREYSPEAWFETVGLMKIHLSGLGDVAKRRPRKSKKARNVTGAVLGMDAGSLAVIYENEDLRDLQIDYAEARERELSDTAICERLEVTAEQLKVLASLSEAKRI